MSQSPSPFDQGVFLTHLHKGKEYFDQDQLQKAREELEAAYQLRPQDEKVLNMLGMTYYKLEMLPQAEEMYIPLAARNPEVYALQSNLGLIQLKLDKLVEARDALNRALDLQPNNSKAHFYMGLLYEKEELWEEALYHFEQANAEKMVSKAKMKLEEQQIKEKLLSPFEVVEVMESENAGFAEQDFSSLMQESQSEPESTGEITGRMRAQDLAEAMFQVHHSDEIVRPEDLLNSQGETEQESEETASIRLKTAEQAMAEEDLIHDHGLEDEITIEEPSWAKTDPAFFPEPVEEPEPLGHGDSSLLIPSALDEPFFLSDDIAADISTFLAQSRPQYEEEDVFNQDPASPELTVLRTAQLEETQEHITPAEPEYRIPTPEEVENEINEPGSTQEELIAERVDQDTSVPRPVESLEELTEELRNEPPPSEEEPVDEEDLEVNFAVVDQEEETKIEEGFLQPSPLTPDRSEENTEHTRDMEYVTAEMQPEVAETPALVAEPSLIEENTPGSTPSESASEEFPGEPEHQPPAVQETAANLDQFSRDRLYIQPLIGSDRFLLIDPHLLEIIISDQLICRIGTISSYTGNLQFTPWTEQKEQIPLIVVSGTGILFLADRRKEIFLISLNNETLFVESNHMLVAQSSLNVEPQMYHQKGSGSSLSIVKVSGRGTLALTCQTKPLTLNVHEGLPANIPAQAVIAWSGKLSSSVLDDDELHKIMSSENDAMFLRFTGAGDVVVEQGGLWGDRRTKR